LETFDLFVKGWPLLLAIVTLIIVLSKLDLRVAVLEEKVRALFELWNKKNEK
jgi:hypothetical protein